MNRNAAVEIREAIIAEDLEIIKKLWIDHLTWGNQNMELHYGAHPHDPIETTEQDIQAIDKFLPPTGRIILALVQKTVCGIGCLKSINTEIGEIKRMYVAPTYRKNGAGRAILDRLVEEAKKIGYQKLRLDSPKFMEAAHALYRSYGFKDIPAYEEVEMPVPFRMHLVYMELVL